MDEIISFLQNAYGFGSAVYTVLSYQLSNLEMVAEGLGLLGNSLKHLVKTPQYFLLALASYGVARALRLFNLNAVVQSHKRKVQTVIDKIAWHRENWLDGNITLEQLDGLIVGLESDISSVMTDTTAIEWDGGKDLSEYATTFGDNLEKFTTARFEAFRLRNGRYLSARDKRETELFLSELIVSLDQYGAEIEQIYMLSPKIFHKFWIWKFDKRFLQSGIL